MVPPPSHLVYQAKRGTNYNSDALLLFHEISESVHIQVAPKFGTFLNAL